MILVQNLKEGGKKKKEKKIDIDTLKKFILLSW